MDKTYEDLAQKVYAESSRNDESRSANYEFPDDVPIESSQEKKSAVEKQLKYQRYVLVAREAPRQTFSIQTWWQVVS